MKRTNVLAVFVGLAAITAFSPKAFGMQHPRQARFLQRDPIGYANGMSLYEYVGSNPITSLDPGGLFSFSKFWKAFKIYYNLNDVGTPYARELIWHYGFGKGKLFERGWRYYHKKSWWSGKTIHSPQNPMISTLSWSKFMKDRLELQATGRAFYKKKTEELCERYKRLFGRNFEGNEVPFDWNAPPTILKKLDSMLITLSGSKRIQVTGYWVIRFESLYKNKCDCSVDYKWVTWTWHDTGDLHPNKFTILDGVEVPDSDFLDVGIGKPYPIRIHWTDRKATWRVPWDMVPGGRLEAKYIAGWPKPLSTDSSEDESSGRH